MKKRVLSVYTLVTITGRLSQRSLVPGPDQRGQRRVTQNRGVFITSGSCLDNCGDPEFVRLT